jgi:hypothetical protein
MEKKVWYVAGASKGLGLALTHRLLTQGLHVAATSRLLPALAEATGGKTLENFLPLEVDLFDQQSIADSIKTTWETFGRIDVVVNNASLSTGAFSVIPAALPLLQSQGHGHIIDIAPVAGMAVVDNRPSPGIRRTTVTFGAFRTLFLSGEAHTAQALYVSIDGRQLADPKKAAAALMRLPVMAEAPALLVLDSDAYRRSTAKMVEFDNLLPRSRCHSSLTSQAVDGIA